MFHGSCLCGEVHYTLDISEEDSKKTSTCHCRTCRKITAATTSLNLSVPQDAFNLTQGTLKTIAAKHIDEGFEFSIVNCQNCGTTIYALAPTMNPAIKIIQVGTLDDAGPIETTPCRELNVKYRVGWVGKVQSAVQCRTYVE